MDHEFCNSGLSGRKIAVVEDEFLIAKDICDILQSAGAEVVGPFATVDRALAGLAQAEPAAVLLDINLAGDKSLPVAQSLAARDIPFLVVSGYGPLTIEDDLLRKAPAGAKTV